MLESQQLPHRSTRVRAASRRLMNASGTLWAPIPFAELVKPVSVYATQKAGEPCRQVARGVRSDRLTNAWN